MSRDTSTNIISNKVTTINSKAIITSNKVITTKVTIISTKDIKDTIITIIRAKRP